MSDLAGAERPRGDAECHVVIGEWVFRLTGIDSDLAVALATRWGAFVRDAPAAPPARLGLRVVDGGARRWLDPGPPGEAYRVETVFEGDVPVVRSYDFAMAPDAPGTWRVAVGTAGDVPPSRIIDNALRMLVARVAVEDGGFALHAAGVLRHEGAHLFAGPSRAGKSTAASLSSPCVSLGDDFGVVLPSDGGWVTAAVPFDNEDAPRDAPAGLLPLRGVWRLFQADEHRLEVPPDLVRESSILACAAAPWTMPDLAPALLENVRRFGETAPFGHLHFRPDPGFWDVLGPL